MRQIAKSMIRLSLMLVDDMVSLNVAQSLSQLSPVAFPEYSYGIVNEFRFPFRISVFNKSLIVPFIGSCP